MCNIEVFFHEECNRFYFNQITTRGLGFEYQRLLISADTFVDYMEKVIFHQLSCQITSVLNVPCDKVQSFF